MEVIVDGIIFEMHAKGGISRLYQEILPRMCQLDDALRITLLTEGKVKQSVPQHSRIAYWAIPSAARYLRPRRVWKPLVPPVRHFLRSLWIGRGGGKIWHSTYYTRPEQWNGAQVVTVPDMIHERFADLYDGPSYDEFRVQKRCRVQEADAVICISETTRQDLLRLYGLDSDSIYVIPLAHSDVFKPMKQEGDNVGGLATMLQSPFLLYVGARSRYKNFSQLMRAYSVWPRRTEVSLVAVGKPWSADEERRLMELGIQDRVHLLVDVDDEALSQLYSRAVAFVYTSLYEGFGIPLLEAMACGCPVIASRIPSTIEVAGECAVYFEPTETESLIAAFDLALSEGRSSERVQAGLDRVKRYSWDETAKQTLGVYHALRSGMNSKRELL